MTTKVAGTVLTVSAAEQLTAANASLFTKQVRAAVNGHTIIQVDLSGTTTMDCGGLGALIAVRNLVHRSQGSVRLVGAAPSVRRLLDVTCARDLFEIVDAVVAEPQESRSVGALALTGADLAPRFAPLFGANTP